MNKQQTYSLFHIQLSGGALGSVLAAVSLAVCALAGDWGLGVLLAALFLLGGLVRIWPKYPFTRFVLVGVWALVCIFLSGAIPSVMLSEQGYLAIGHYRVAMNFVCVAVVYGLCLVAAGEIRRAATIASTLLMLLATANTFLFAFRGTELRALDFLSWRTALEVVDQYTFRISLQMVEGWLLWGASMFCLWRLPAADFRLPRGFLRGGAALATGLCVALTVYGSRDISTQSWGNDGTTYNGFFLNFYTSFRDSLVREVPGYAPQTVEALAETYASGDAVKGDLPNILVIMNESFADFSVLGEEPRTNQPVTPFLDALEENTVRGYALSSVFGGGTANSEFEFLTGASMANLPEGSTPYQQYIAEDTFALPWLLDSLGYETLATHPYIAHNWNRPLVYPHLGFEASAFEEAYPWKNLVREYVSDQEMYEYLLQRLEDRGEKPLFLFGVTMQNHGDYLYIGEDYQQTIYLEGYGEAYPMAEQYLTLLNESDKALAYLLTALEDFPEDTVVLFFGDHFPKVEEDLFQTLHGGRFETLPEQMLQYQVPFFLWANYDLPEETVACTSLNYLGVYLLEAAGIDLPPYYQFLKELEQHIPAVNALGYYSLSQGTFLPLEEAEGEEAQWLNLYAQVSYNNLFDGDNRSDSFFDSYLP